MVLASLSFFIVSSILSVANSQNVLKPGFVKDEINSSSYQYKNPRDLRQWSETDIIDFRDGLYEYWNEDRGTDSVDDQVVLSKDGKNVAVKVRRPDTSNSFHAIYEFGDRDGKFEWHYAPREDFNHEAVIPSGASFSLSTDGNSKAISHSTCDKSAEYAEYKEGVICLHVNSVTGNHYKTVNGTEWGMSWGRSVSVSHDGVLVAIGSSEGKVFVYKVTSLITIGVAKNAMYGDPIDVSGVTSTSGQIVKMAGNEANPTVVVGGKGDKISVYDYISDSNSWIKVGGDINVNGNGETFDVSHHGNIVAVGRGNNKVRVYELTDVEGEKVWKRRGRQLQAGINGYASISLSDDGNILAIGSYSGDKTPRDPGYVELFEFAYDDWIGYSFVVKGNPALEDKVDFAKSVSISGDGKILAVAAPAYMTWDTASSYAMVYEVGNSFPSSSPSSQPTSDPSKHPSSLPSMAPIVQPSMTPSVSQLPSLNPTASPSLSPSVSQLPSLSPSDNPSLLPSTSPSVSPSISAQPSQSPSISQLPSFSPSYFPTSSTCLGNCDCKTGSHCDMSECLFNCNCIGGYCDMSNCKKDCRCKGGNCNMNRCEGNCQCEMRGCQMDNCIYNSQCRGGRSSGGTTRKVMNAGIVTFTLISLLIITL